MLNNIWIWKQYVKQGTTLAATAVAVVPSGTQRWGCPAGTSGWLWDFLLAGHEILSFLWPDMGSRFPAKTKATGKAGGARGAPLRDKLWAHA